VAPVADVANTPVWYLFAATVALAAVTGVLALAAWRALGQLRVAFQQLELTVEQLAQAKRDRQSTSCPTSAGGGTISA